MVAASAKFDLPRTASPAKHRIRQRHEPQAEQAPERFIPSCAYRMPPIKIPIRYAQKPNPTS
jgi:hypothetical protein